MYEFLTASANLPFTVALAVMLLLLLIEVVGFISGLGLSDFIDGLLPDMADADGAELAGASVGDRFLGWLLLGKVPALILFAVFLTGFGLIGLLLQWTLLALAGFMLPGWLAALIALPLSLPWVRVVGTGIARVLPRDETQVTSRRSLVGHVATIVIGSARRGSAAQAKLRDGYGQTHYVMVEPREAGDEFHAGDAVLLIAQAGALFHVIRPDHPGLVP
jgi:hypothetical protein